MRKLIATGVALLCFAGASQAQTGALKIVVLEGEGAVNVIQQKTAVRPLIEVRDRNNVPVAGASVTFTIAGGGGHAAAFAGGAQTLTVTTNAAGQAAASGLNALANGAFQVQVQAAYQGQVATAAITQTNFATAAAASQAGAGASAAGGGGLSATTIGIIGAAAAGGAVAVTQATSKSSNEKAAQTFRGALNGQLVFTSLATDTQGRPTNCDRTRTVAGNVEIGLDSAMANGTALFRFTQTEVSVTGGGCGPAPGEALNMEDLKVSGGPGALVFTGTSQSGGTTIKVDFKGALAGDAINGTFSIGIQAAATAPNQPTGFGSTTIAVILQK